MREISISDEAELAGETTPPMDRRER